MKTSFSNFIREKRIAAGLTLREFCRLSGFDASNWSKVERGLLTPPQSKKVLSEIATILKIEEGSEEYKEMLESSDKINIVELLTQEIEESNAEMDKEGEGEEEL